MRATPLLCFILSALVAPASSQAALCSDDNVPAASLLMPYFEVSALCTPGNGRNSRFTVTNVDKAAVLTRVTLWSNAGVPALEFDIYLNGYDQQTIDLAAVLCNGNLPSTGQAVIPGPGRFSALGTAFAGCNAGTTPAVDHPFTAPARSGRRNAPNCAPHSPARRCHPLQRCAQAFPTAARRWRVTSPSTR